MKKIDSEILTEEWVTLNDLADLVNDLDVSDHVWLTLYADNDDNPNYVQVHSEVEPEELKIPGVKILSQDRDPEDNEDVMFLLEARVYSDPAQDIFTHYRIYTTKKEYILACFKSFYNDKYFEYEQWQDVTDEF